MKKVSKIKGAEFSEYLLNLIDSVLAVRFCGEIDFVDEVAKGHRKNSYASVRQLLAMLVNILDN